MEIQIDSAGLSAISAANQSVTLSRQVNQAVDVTAGGSLTVAWQVFAPLETNTVSWTNQYYCFATATPLSMNAVITMNSQLQSAMVAGFVYQFAQGQFAMLQPPQGGSDYIVSNGTQQPAFAFGLAQAATVNDVAVAAAPFCVVPVLYNQAAYFIPSGTIGIFLSSASVAGTLLPPPSNPCVVSATGAVGSEPTIGFDDQTNTFYQIS